jgi:hypothetical protein
MTAERKTRGSLLDPADSNNGVNDPENDGGRFLKRPRTSSEGRSAERPPDRTSPFWQNDLPKRPRPRFGNRGPAFQRSFRDEPQNDLGAVFENTRGQFGRVVSKNDLEGRFRKTTWPVNIQNYRILPYNPIK